VPAALRTHRYITSPYGLMGAGVIEVEDFREAGWSSCCINNVPSHLYLYRNMDFRCKRWGYKYCWCAAVLAKLVKFVDTKKGWVPVSTGTTVG
jgi:hypothetical protein